MILDDENKRKNYTEVKLNEQNGSFGLIDYPKLYDSFMKDINDITERVCISCGCTFYATAEGQFFIETSSDGKYDDCMCVKCCVTFFRFDKFSNVTDISGYTDLVYTLKEDENTSEELWCMVCSTPYEYDDVYTKERGMTQEEDDNYQHLGKNEKRKTKVSEDKKQVQQQLSLF